MEITLFNRTNSDISSFEPLFHQIADQAKNVLKLDCEYLLSVTFVRSRTIHALNRDYRGIDRPTDVISFAAQDDTDFFFEEEEKDLGDIFINIDYAKKQAGEYGHSYEREICFLFTHGMLHCLGYDHMTEEDEKVMFALQKQILDPLVARQ